jgi:hypothetical protein
MARRVINFQGYFQEKLGCAPDQLCHSHDNAGLVCNQRKIPGTNYCCAHQQRRHMPTITEGRSEESSAKVLPYIANFVYTD